ncbi:MAG: PAS domain S-box protein [Flavobacteriales bacterium]
MGTELDILKRRFEREKNARKRAEKILEKKSLELYHANKKLIKSNSELEARVIERTEELRETESRYRLIVETASDLIYMFDPNGMITYANQTAIEKIGYTLEELNKMEFFELIDTSFREELVAFYHNQFVNKQSGSYREFPVINAAGKTIWIGQNIIFIYNQDGSIKQVNAVARDITEIKLSQTRLHNLISTLQAGVLLEDKNRKIVLVNQTFCDLFGFPINPEDLVGVDCSNSAEESKVHFDDESGFVDRITEILKYKKEVLNDELFLKDGRIFERDYIPIYIESQYSGHLWNYRDVTEQRTYVKAIKRSEEKYRSIIENMNLGLLEVDKHERVIYANQSFCKMSGYELDEILSRVATDLFVRGENAELMEDKRNLRIEGVVDAYEIATKNKRGEAKWWLISGAPLFDELGKSNGSVGIHLDITQQKKTEKELVEAKYLAEESSKVKEVFLANMSHEIRTPMNGILGMARQLEKSSLNESQEFQLSVIKSAADNLMVVLNDILDISKIEAGKLSIENVSFNLANSLKKACNVMLPKAEEKGLALEIEVDSKISQTLIGDPFRLNQVLFNLVGNSIKFTEKGGVKISGSLLEQKGDVQLIRLAVEDTGIGIDEEYLQKIFEKFTQEDRSTARKFGGTGLGMNITKQLIDLMGGEIAVTSEKGKGTRVIINVPFLSSDKEIDLEQKDKINEIDLEVLNGKNILVAEDNELNRLVIESTLAYYNLNMLFAVNGKEAIELLTKRQVDLVLMDIQMPVMDGIESTHYIRKELKMNLPIIALTANVLKGDTEGYLKAGMNDTIPKPFDENDVVFTLLKWLGGSNRVSSVNGGGNVVSNESYSLDKLKAISRGDQAFLTKMLSIFIEQAEKTITEIQLAQSTGSLERIRKLAHKIKPSLDNLAITQLKETVRKLEKIGTEVDPEELSTLSQVFSDELSKIVSELKELNVD